MERTISPTPTLQEAGRPQPRYITERRTSYRLFPLVDQTPPASPVTLQKAFLTKAAGSYRRRSSSLENRSGGKDPSAATGHATLSTSLARVKDNSRKASLPEIRPLRSSRDREYTNDVSAKLQTLPPRPHTAVDRALEGSVEERSNSVEGEYSLRDRNPSISASRENHAAPHGLGFNFPSTPVKQGARVRPRPNLRIAIAKEQRDGDRPPPPPPKSPRHARDDSDLSQQQHLSPKRQLPSPSVAHNRDDSDPPVTPSVAQQQSFVSLSPSVKVRELTVSPVARGRSSRKETPSAMHGLLPSDFLEKPLPPIAPGLQPPSSKFSDPSARPLTSDGSQDAVSAGRGSSVPPPQRLAPKLTDWRPTDHVQQLRSRLISSSTSNLRQAASARPMSPQAQPLASHPVKASWNDLPTTTSRPVQRSITPEPTTRVSDYAALERPLTASPGHGTAQDSRALLSTDYMPPESLSKASLALAAARANVAALRNSNASSGSPGSDRRSRSSGSDIGSLSRQPSDGVPRRLPSPGANDPVETLKDLSEQCEALHVRYASLKAERQKISSSIIATLKEQKPAPDQVNSLLDEQLSLAAISSSMDICFAKLKSLECRKEDAIAALIAKTTQAQKSPSENISAMIASMALTRKTSLAPSTDSGSRFAPTGRSTPDLADNTSMHRLTQPSTRTLSYGSEPETLDYRSSSVSRKQSTGGESVLHNEGGERQAPATIPEDSESPRSQRVSRIHDTASLADNPRTSDVSALSPVRESHSHQSLSQLRYSNTVEEQQDEQTEDSPDTTIGAESARSPTSERSMSPDDLLDEQPKRIRVNGSKAAKILGLLAKGADGKENPLIRLPEHKKAAAKVTTVEVELHSTSQLENVVDASSPGISTHTKETDDSAFDAQTSSDVHDLEHQLKSFPKPNPNPLSTHSSTSGVPDGRRDTGGSFLTNGSSADEPDEPPDLHPAPIRMGRRQEPSPHNRSKPEIRKRDPSAHTIQVYLEDDEILDYYNRMRAEQPEIPTTGLN